MTNSSLESFVTEIQQYEREKILSELSDLAESIWDSSDWHCGRQALVAELRIKLNQLKGKDENIKNT